jgi:hypothetical protein
MPSEENRITFAAGSGSAAAVDLLAEAAVPCPIETIRRAVSRAKQLARSDDAAT